ncbi:MAG: site-specific DNA-methyltransferase [Deltaproteobacteria bacterium]|nr:site-specific DNA-methyltransferase [Deltaproteobacteria bacterium]MBW2078510.1 site-specific DNA-methyltransferase [Deltaproteobacteria bacterium]
MPIKPVQLDLFRPSQSSINIQEDISPEKYREIFRKLLNENFDFHGENSNYATHNFHAFPAKFPPQLPKKFITTLTLPGEKVLDPMSGSGTTVLEAMLLGRHGIGIDIDPLALNLGKVKVTSLDLGDLMRKSESLIDRSSYALRNKKDELTSTLDSRFDPQTKRFVDYWFLRQTQLELLALIQEIERLADRNVRRFFEIVFSSIIITKSGGVSLAYDLAHTRPHKLRDKVPRSASEEFQKRLNKNIKRITQLAWSTGRADIFCGNAQRLGLSDNSIDLIVTSPPYPSNAIDYMRTHKFSLVWFGYDIASLSGMRGDYMGGERTSNFQMRDLPDYSHRVASNLSEKDPKKANVLMRYYTEMSECLSEMFRVLKPGRAAAVVVGSSVMRGIDTETSKCLAEIGKTAGFNLVGITQRKLDRNKRMMPARHRSRSGEGGGPARNASQSKAGGPVRENEKEDTKIEERMHKEYIIGFLKPN